MPVRTISLFKCIFLKHVKTQVTCTLSAVTVHILFFYVLLWEDFKKYSLNILVKHVWIKCRLVPLTFKDVEALFPLSKIFCSSFGLLVWFWLLWKVYIKTFGLVETPLPRFEERKNETYFLLGAFLPGNVFFISALSKHHFCSKKCYQGTNIGVIKT